MSEEKELNEYRFKEIQSKLESIESKLDERLKRIEEILIIGNGKPSIKSRVENLETENATRNDKAKTSWQVWLAIGLCILPQFIQLIQWLISKVPA